MSGNMKEVARRAGVSIATVSHVINGTRAVNPDTKQRVLTAIEGLNYVPNAAAKTLKSKQSRTIKIILPKAGFSYYRDMHLALVEGMLEYWGDKKYSISLHQIDYQNEESVTEIFLHTVDGIMVFSPTDALYQSLIQKNTKIPCVFLNYQPEEEEDENFIYIDHFHTMYKEVAKLLKGNSQSIGYLENTESNSMNEECKAAYRSAFSEQGLPLKEELIKSIPASSDGGYEVAKSWLETNQADAIICNDEALSLGVTRYLLEKRKSIPTIFYATHKWGSLYEHGETIQIPCHKIALQASEMLYQLMSKNEEEVPNSYFRTETIKEEPSYHSVEKANRYIEKNKVSPATKWKQSYHITPEVGWLNDPNGLVQFKDEYHVFYQYHPYGAEWGPMHWGHAKSKDLVHWEHLPVALAPDQSYEKGCFSGSGIEHDHELLLFYTAQDDHNKMKQVQCMATSSDGINFKKNANNPLIKNISGEASEDFRDPKVWKYEGHWYMLIGTSKNQDGRAVLYKSSDLSEWEFFSVVATSNGELGEIWECPDLFSLNHTDFLMLSSLELKGAKNVLLVGNFDYETGKFEKQQVRALDFGRDFYAAQTFQDKQGRRILIGWMNIWGEQFPTQKEGWAGSLTLPREIKLDEAGNLRIVPVPQLEKLRSKKTASPLSQVNGQQSPTDIKGNTLEIQCEFEIGEQAPTSFGLHVRKSKKGDEYTEIRYQVDTRELMMNLQHSGKNGKGQSTASLDLLEGNKLRLHLFLDKSSIELFANDGVASITNRVYPKESSIYVDVFSEGGEVIVHQLIGWELENIW